MTSPSESQGIQSTAAGASSHDVQTMPDAPPHGEGHVHDHGVPPPPFTDKDEKEFHDEDVHAGGAVVALMGGIFTIGLLMYATIALIVAG